MTAFNKTTGTACRRISRGKQVAPIDQVDTVVRPHAPPFLVHGLGATVVKPRHGQGGKGVVNGAHADGSDLERLAAELQRRPEAFVVQPIVPLSLHPTVIDGRLQPRHVDLRPFAFCAEPPGMVPGGLTRVALDEGALVVNSSQQGGGKDTWVLD